MMPVIYTDAQRRKFTELFGQNIRTYWCNITGLDVIKLDEELVKPADGVSTCTKLRSEWGEDAVTLIKELMALPSAA